MASYCNTYIFAGIPVEVVHEYSYIAEKCKEYLTKEKPLFTLTLTKETWQPDTVGLEAYPFPEGFFEWLAFYRLFCEHLISQKIIPFHRSAIAVDGEAYLFTAPSGTGKSTHTRLWRQIFGERAVMINDDKPILKIENGTVMAYGTPWAGKEGLQNPISAPVKGICILTRGDVNRIERITSSAALPKLLLQTHRPQDNNYMKQLLPTLIEIANLVPLWRLECYISEEAAHTSYQAMKNG